MAKVLRQSELGVSWSVAEQSGGMGEKEGKEGCVCGYLRGLPRGHTSQGLEVIVRACSYFEPER